MADQEDLAAHAASVGGFTAVTVEEPSGPWRSDRPATTYLVMADEDERVQRLGASIAEAMADHRQRCAMEEFGDAVVVDVPQHVTRDLHDMLGLVVEARPPAHLEPVDVLLLARTVSGLLARVAGGARCARSGAIPIPFGRHVAITTVSI